MKQHLYFLYSTFIGLLILGTSSMAQPSMSVGARLFYNDLKKLSNTTDLPSSFIAKYDLSKKNGVHYVGVSAMVSSEINASDLTSLGIINDSRIQSVYTFRVPVSSLENFLQLPGLAYIDISESASPDLNVSIPSARVDSVHAGFGNLLKSYFGKGVVIAIIDWGFDYTHPNFYDTAMSQMRLVRAWDQNKLSGPAPAGFSFGTEYVGASELLNAKHDTLYTFGPTSHGTHVGGIASGNGSGTSHRGAAPGADLIFISLKRDSPSLIDAYSYISKYAASVNKPFVVNMSFGLHLGPHDGSLLPNVVMDAIQGPGKVFVASAGNNGTSAFHIRKDFTSAAAGDTLKTVVGFSSDPNYFGQTLSIWGSQQSSFEASLILADNSNNILFQTPFYASSGSPSVNEINIVNGDTLHLILEGIANDFLSNRPNIQMEIRNKTGLKVVLLITSQNSDVHAWNTVRLNNRYTNWGVAFSTAFPGAVAGDIEYGIGEPGGCGKSTITVGSYRAEQVLPNGNLVHGSLSTFTSRGPTVDERTKPEISSTGQNVVSSINSNDIAETSGFTTTVQWDGRTYAFKPYSGTSMSAPMVSGIVALMLEAFPALSAAQAKEILKATARLDVHTGQIGTSGSNIWGWGKANALAAVKAAEILSHTSQSRFKEAEWKLYPNPANDVVFFESLNTHPGNANTSVEIFSMQGKRIKSILIPEQMQRFEMSLTDLPSGTYLVQFGSRNNFSFQTLVVR
jgi:minor extracellular serine protease Vpr